MDKSSKVYEIVKEIPRGKVMTYGQVGNILNINPRLVGSVLHKNPDGKNIPCHRVVNSLGKTAERYSFGGKKSQDRKLAQEGVEFLDGKVNLKKCLYIK